MKMFIKKGASFHQPQIWPQAFNNGLGGFDFTAQIPKTCGLRHATAEHPDIFKKRRIKGRIKMFVSFSKLRMADIKAKQATSYTKLNCALKLPLKKSPVHFLRAYKSSLSE